MNLYYKEYRVVSSNGIEPKPVENVIWINTSYPVPKWLRWTADGWKPFEFEQDVTFKDGLDISEPQVLMWDNVTKTWEPQILDVSSITIPDLEFNEVLFSQPPGISDKDIFASNPTANGCEIKYVIDNGVQKESGVIYFDINNATSSMIQTHVRGDLMNVWFEAINPNLLRVVNNSSSIVNIKLVIFYF